MMPLIFIISTLLLGPKSFAATQDDPRLLLHARNLAELDAQTALASVLKDANENCEAELKANLLPRSCFRALSLQTRQPRSKSTEEIRHLADVCVETAKKSGSRLDLSGDLEILPADCRTQVRFRADDLRYMDEARRPELSVRRTPGPEVE